MKYDRYLKFHTDMAHGVFC